jgi:hypothetical protein
MTQKQVRKMVEREVSPTVNGKLAMGHYLTSVEHAFVLAIYTP